MNSVNISGRNVRDPEVRQTQGGTTVVSTTLAVDKRLSREKKEQMKASGESTADFINVVAFGALGEVLASFTGKGNRIEVTGRLSVRGYQDKEGNKRTATEVVAESIDIIDFKQAASTNVDGIDEFHPVDDSDIPF